MLEHLNLGKSTEYQEQYAPSLLQAVSRNIGRESIGLSSLPFSGEDLWNGYEFSWLNKKGKPQIATLQCHVPFDSPNLIESKSFKLYLNSFNQSRFESKESVLGALKKDLSLCAGSAVDVQLFDISDTQQWQIKQFEAICIDDEDIEVQDYQPRPDLLIADRDFQEETLISHLLKSNCLITNQPDWASVIVKYVGPGINRESLLKYLVSFRQHNEFHEQCVERIFCDILQQCKPDKLTVLARYTRRGGLDINPFRSNFEAPYPNIRLVRQ